MGADRSHCGLFFLGFGPLYAEMVFRALLIASRDVFLAMRLPIQILNDDSNLRARSSPLAPTLRHLYSSNPGLIDCRSKNAISMAVSN